MYLDLFIRAFTRARWVEVATTRGIYTGELSEDGKEIVAPGYLVDEIGAVIITPGQWDEDGNEIVAPVFDTWWSCNLRIHTVALATDADTTFEAESRPFTRSKLVRFIRENGTQVDLNGVRAYQFGTGANRIQILDPRDIAMPQRIWVGGVFF